MLLLALSCLQGRPMKRAFDELLALADGVQLTPGCHPTPAFSAQGFVTRTHQGFAIDQRATRVWTEDALCLADSDSVHAPDVSLFEALARSIASGARVPALETMYPGYALGSGAELAWAMARRLPLAVDVSHLYLQREAGVIDDDTLARVLDYDAVAEVHISANDGAHDLHLPIDAHTFGLEWARQRERAGTPLVLECYMHRMSIDARKRQIALLKE